MTTCITCPHRCASDHTCRAMPPTVVIDEQAYVAAWPEVEDDEWCAEHPARQAMAWMWWLPTGQA